MRSSLPTGDSSWNSSRLMVCPTTQTLSALRTSRVGEHVALVEILPVADLQEGGRGAVDVHGHPVAVAVDDLRAGPDDGGHVADGRALAGDLVGVLRA